MADWLSQEPPEACNQVDQFVAALNNPSGTTASGLTTAQLTGLAARATTLRASTADKLAKETAYTAAVEKEKDDYAVLAAEFRALYRAANSNLNMTDAFRGAAGMTIRDTEPGPRPLPEVTDAAAVGRPSGNNFLDWSAADSEGVTWQVETAPAEAGPWTVIGTTSRTDFLHEGAGAGTTRKYRVVPKRGNRVGEPSNIAAVY